MNNTVDKFKAVRKLFPVTGKSRGITYLNCASTGPLCKPVKKVLDDYYEANQYLDKNSDIAAFDDLAKIRKLGARMIGARADEIGFGFHTGYGLNIAAFGLPLKRGDEVLLSDIEFPSNVYPWLALRERGIKVKFIKSVNKRFDIDNFRKAIGVKNRKRKKSKVLSLSFVQFFNGYKNDLTTIGQICKDNGLYFVVDGIQGCGVETVNVHRSQVDIFSAGAQKWQLTPQGAGLFYVRKDIQEKLITPFASWLSVDWNLNFTDLFHYDLPYFDSARRFEMGSYPYSHVHAMAAALDLIDSLGVKNIQRHNHQLLDILIDYLKSSPYYRVVSDLKNKHRSSILAFTCDDVKTVHKRLLGNKIICVQREGAIRISVHLFNNEADIKRLIAVLSEFDR